MRMWMVNPRLLCRQHLLGEHGEIHKHLPSLRRGVKISGRFSPTAHIQLNCLKERHDKLAEEMRRRGMNHRSPLVDVPDLRAIYPDFWHRQVDIEESKRDLCERCEKCKYKIEHRRIRC